MTEEGEAKLEAIWLKTERRGAMAAVREADLVEGLGLEGNADRGGVRQVTLLEVEAWERAMEELGADVDPAARRANLLVRGIDLRDSADRVLEIAGCRIRIRGETRPCARMDEAAAGLRNALEPDWRGGAYGMVLEGGRVAVGDPVRWEG